MPPPAPATPRGSGEPTSLTASPSIALAVAVIHAVQDDEGKGEEAKLHLGGRAGERRLSKSGNWRAHPRSRRKTALLGKTPTGEPPLASGAARISSASLRLEPERRREAGWREAQGGSCLFTRPNLRKEGRGESEPTAWRETRSGLTRSAQLQATWRAR